MDVEVGEVERGESWDRLSDGEPDEAITFTSFVDEGELTGWGVDAELKAITAEDDLERNDFGPGEVWLPEELSDETPWYPIVEWVL